MRASATDSTTDHALQSIPDLESLRKFQQRDYLFGEVREDLLQEKADLSAPRVTERYVLDDNDFLWYADDD